jgi:iron complex transport system permease protein
MKRFSSFRLGERFSLFIDRKALMVIFGLVLVLTISFLISLGIGEVFVSPIDVFKVLIGEGNDFHNLIIEKFRLPRVLIALMSGMALAVSGALLQAIVRNPLASPDMIGITGGASVAAVALITFFTGSADSLSVSIHWVPVVAFIGATITAGLIYLLAWKKGTSPLRFVLIGIGFYTITHALTDLIILLGPVFRAAESKTWVTGSVYGSDWSHVYSILPWMCILIPLSFMIVKTVNIQQFGEEIAIGVGNKIQKSRLLLFLMSTALAGAGVAFAGGISFVGLIAPHAARRLVGSSYEMLIPASALLGGIMVVLADLLGRTIAAPLEIPAGVFTAVIGTPYFIYLLFRSRK